ncbi:MAG: hypothetical protein NUV60_01265 [Patescibacteria group bacterium]|nr:hypothetical protein [Patescibacteria group bacterium]
MSTKPFIGVLAGLLMVITVAPAALLVAPQRVSASGVSCIGGLLGLGSSAFGVVTSVAAVPVSNLSIEGSSASAAGSTASSCIYDAILVPLARAAIRAMLQQMTASVINWITGRNGTGQPSFVTNLSVHLQSVGDATALAFINQTVTGFNSPFGPAIASSLQSNYLQNTSMAGFFSANMNTLARSSPDVNSYLNGNWSQGGVGSWFALTTQAQNNPYTLYQSAGSQLSSNVAQAQTNRRQDLVQSSGFLSWCGGSTTSASSCTPTASGACPQGCVPNFDTESNGCSPSGVSPQAPCTNPDGTPAQAQTPGSIIHDYTQKAVVNSGFEQLISSNDLDTALGSIVTALFNQVLGGVNGLLGTSAPSSSSSGRSGTVTGQLQTYAAGNTSSSASAVSLAQSTLSNITNYTNAWNTITSAANTASTSLDSLATFCLTAAQDAETNPDSSIGKTPAFVTASTDQAAAAQAAIPASIVPVITQAQSALSSVAATKTFALQVEEEAASASSVTTANTTAATTLAADIATLAAMPPSATDVAAIQQNAQVFNGAQASPVESFNVSGGSLIDRMNLIGANATALKDSVCTPMPPTDYGG